VSLSGGGDFGNRYQWYVDNVRRVVSQNWLMYEVDPHTTPNERVYLTFDINRNGQPMNVRIERSSGIPSLDSSAVRALQRIDTFGPLPPDYRGSSVGADFILITARCTGENKGKSFTTDDTDAHGSHR
jgi:TonB family C-terminal domain